MSSRTPTEKGWFSIQSAADYSDFSDATIEMAIKQGKLRSKKVNMTGSGKRFHRRIKREWLDAWIEEQPED